LIFLILFSFILIFLNLDKLDVSQNPVKSDLLLCLGGGTGERIEKTIALYKDGFINYKIIISDTKEKDVVKKTNKLKESINNDEIIISKSFTKNTLDELLFSQEILEKYNYKSILIISDEPHTRRIKMLIENFTKFKQLNIEYTIVGSSVKWWDKKSFYKNNTAIFFSIHEFIKIIYNYILYNLLYYSLIDYETVNLLHEYKSKIKIQIDEIIKKILY
jgi:uncharacterized SAM-binding protein YcdF (DUF218 family)